MIYRVLLAIILFGSLLYATPSIEQMKAAIAKDPSLLDTPQAQAIMREKGLSREDVENKLAKQKKMATEVIDVNDIENQIEIIDNNESNVSEDLNITEEDFEDLSIRLNPFAYKSSKEIREELNTKQQVLMENKLLRYSFNFYANKNLIDSSSLPTPSSYILSTGDTITLHIYGDRDKKYELEVNSNGNIELEYIGPVRIAGMSFREAKLNLQNRLKAHYKMSSFNVTISKYSSIQVTLIGDVKHPGIYNLSSFSTAKDLLTVAKGVRESASVREILIKRNSKTIKKLDFYDLLFKGKTFGGTLLRHGDIIVIQNAKKLVSIDGYINNAAIFELNNDENLDKLIKYAGGMKANASKKNIKIERYSNNSLLETFNISYQKAKNFKMKNGDRVYIYPLSSSASTSINLYGNIIRPGSYRIGVSKDLTEFFKMNLKEGIKKFFLPQTHFEYGVIKRYSKLLNYETVSFNLSKVISGEEHISLKAQDELYIFSNSDVSSSEYITIKGEVLVKDGKFQYFKGMTIRDALNAAGINGIVDDKVRVTTINTVDRMPKTVFYSLKDNGNVQLSPYDDVEIYDYYVTHLLQPISIAGEVINPTTVFYEKDMTLQNLFEIAGGITTKAFLNKIEIVRYYVDRDNNRQKKIMNIDLREINKSKYRLEAYDEVTVYKIPQWGEKESIELKGEVRFPGVYTIGNGEKLSSVIKRAGGFTKEAFIDGAIFTRDSIRVNQIEQYNKALAKIKRELAIFNAMPANAKKAAASAQTSGTLNEVILEAKKYQPIGRVSVQLDANLTEFEDSEFNLVLKGKDTITIPNQIDTVTVFGEVFNPTSFVYSSNKSSDDYIKLASGFSRAADKSSVYVIHADGTSEPVEGGWFSSSIEIKKGDTIVVPIYIKEYDTLEVADTVARILTSFALTAASLTTLGVL